MAFGLFATNVNSQEIKTDSITRANDSIKKVSDLYKLINFK